MEKLDITRHKNGRFGLTYTYEENVGTRLEWDGADRHEQVAVIEQHSDWVLPPDYDQVDALEIPGIFHVSVYGQHGLFLFQSPGLKTGQANDPTPRRWKHLVYENIVMGVRAGFLIEPACPSLNVRKIANFPLYQVEARANNNIMNEAGIFLLEGIHEDIVQVSSQHIVVKSLNNFSLHQFRARGSTADLQLLLSEEKWGKFYKEAAKIPVSTAELDKLEARWKLSRNALSGLFG